MKANKTKRNLKGHITLALVLGMITMIPQTYALPEQGTYQGANGVKATIAAATNIMDITGKQTNTALDWAKFNVGKAETVNFKGATNNYLNLIHDANGSQIMGALNGEGGKIYLINPNGILFGAEAKVNVGTGSLVASTRPLNQVGTTEFAAGNSPLTTLTDSSGVTGNITNLGTLQANKVIFEGNDVTLTNRTNIKNANGSGVLNTGDVVIKAGGTVNVGYDPGTTTRSIIINDEERTVHNYVDGTAASQVNYTITDLEGTAKVHQDAMIVTDIYDLQNINSNLAGHYVLTNDIAADTTSTWSAGSYNNGETIVVGGGFTPLGSKFDHTHGNDVTDFTGSLDGAYCTINNLYQRIPKFNVGLFAENGVTGNISRLNVNGNISGAYYVGAIAGSNKGTISEVSNAATVTGISSYSFADVVGGIVGINTGTVSNASNSGTISGQTFIGGIIGDSTGGVLTNLVNTGKVTADNGSAAGLVASMTGGTLTIDSTRGLKQTTNSGAVTGSSIVGGVVGTIINGTLAGTGEAHQIINTGAVTGTNAVGGVVGFAGTKDNNTGTFNYKYLTNKGTVLNNSTNVQSGMTGGVFGEISQDAKDSTINLSYIVNDANVTSTVSATGGVIGAWQEYGKGSMTYVVNNNTSGTNVVSGTGDVGGVIGYLNDDDVTYNTGYNMATVTGIGDRVGGIVGYLNKGTLKANGDSINNSGAVTGVNQVGGIVGLIGPGGFDQVAWETIPAVVASGTDSGISNSGKITGATQVGGIAGANQSTIAGNASHPIINTGAVTGTDTGALTIADTVTGGMVGGIAGNNMSNISYVINAAAVKGTTLVGGLVGCNEVNPYFGTALQQSSNTGTVTATGTNAEATGGLVGYSKGIITTSYNTGAVTGVKSVGGIVGMSVPVTKDVYDSADGNWAGDAAHFWFEAKTGSSGTNFSEVYNTATVTGTGENVGGIAGLSTGSTYTNLYNTGRVTGGTNVGGILGKGNTAFVSHVYTNAWPSVDTGETKNSVAANTITNTYNIAAVNGTTVGGLVGLAGTGNTVTSSYYATTNAAGDTINAINDSGLGTAKTLAEMKNKETYTGWDLDSVGGGTNVWRIYQKDTTPLLKNWLTPVTVKNLANQNVDYDGLVHTPNVTGVAYDPATVDENKILTTSGIKAGDYAMLYSVQDGYDLLENPTFTINKLLISINLDTNAPTDYTYGATTAPVIGWEFTGFANNETYETAAKTGSVTFDTSAAFNNGKTSKAGNYVYTYNGDLTFDDYTFTTNTTDHGTGTVSVHKANLALNTGAPTDYTYGASAAPVISKNFTGFAYDETEATAAKTGSTSFDTSAAFNNGHTSDAGDYTYTYNGDLVFDNYTFTTNTTNHGTGTITVLPSGLTLVNLNTSAPDDYTYGATAAPIISWEITGFVDGETYNTAAKTGSVTFDTSAAFNNGKTSNAGDYAYTYNGDLLFTNYRFTTNTVDHGIGTITVHKAPLTLTANDVTMTYGQAGNTLNYGYTVDAVKKLVNGDTAAVLSGITYGNTAYNGDGTTKNVGSNYTVTPVVSLTNYDVTAKAGVVTMNKADLALQANNVTMSYGQKEKDVTYGYTIDAVKKLINGDTTAVLSGITYTNTAYNGDGTTKDVAQTYTVNPVVNLANYNVTTTEGEVTMKNALLDLTANHVTMTYGEKESDIIYGYTIDAAHNLVNGNTTDLLSGITYTNTAYNGDGTTKNVAQTYTVTPTVTVKNYDVTTHAGSVTMDKAILTMNVNNVTMTYGQDANSIAYGNTTTGFVNGDTTAVLSGIKYVNTAYNGDGTTKGVAQTYTVVPTTTLANYDISATVGAVTMNKAQLTITPQQGVNVIYGDTELISKLGYNVTGFTNGDSADVLSGMPTYTTGAWEGSKTGKAGTYKDVLINGQGTLSAENYDLTLDTTTKGSVTIAPAGLTLTADKVTMREGDTLPASFRGNVSGYVNGDSASESPFFNWTGSSGAPTVGTYGIIGYLGGKSSGLYDNNYYILQNPDNSTAMTVTSRLSSADYALGITSLVPRHGNQIVTPLYGMWVSQPAGTVRDQREGQKVKKTKESEETSYYVDLDSQRHNLE